MAVHLYGVARADTPVDAATVPGRQDREVRLVVDNGLAAIVSDVDETQPVGRDDLLSHAHVLERFVDDATVLPMRFGIALPDDEATRDQLLQRERQSLEHLLTALDGSVQVTVQAFLQEEPALREVLRRRPDLRAARDELQGRPEEVARSGEIELGQAITTALDDLKDEVRTLVVGRLAPLARAVAENEPTGALEAATVAFLVDRHDRAEFDAAVTALRAETESTVRLRYVGPQPAYSFLESARDGEI